MICFILHEIEKKEKDESSASVKTEPNAVDWVERMQ